MKVNFSNVQAPIHRNLENLKLICESHRRVAIIGPSGMGKSFIGRAVDAFSTDYVGSEIDDKWFVNTNKLPETGVCEGTGDNLKSWVKVFDPDLIVVVAIESGQKFKEVMAAKARDYDGENQHFIDHWLKKSKWSARQANNYIVDKTRMHVDIAEWLRIPSIVFVNSPQESIRAGWDHKN
uniref:Uncharacterized protein n=1 Tax=viral metagenome TaxID=1070528 RepID=A0A2V0RA24_9ZZZZ